jgi:regulation of enolase protein 1 (concanavalin A-like superfamily)
MTRSPLRVRGPWLCALLSLGPLAASACGGSKNETVPVDARTDVAVDGRAGSGGTGGSGGMGSGGTGGGGAIDAPAVPVDGSAPDGVPPDTRPVVSMSPVPAPWTGQDIGTVGMPGGSGRSRREFQVRGSGTDIWAEADGFHFVHQPVSGDFEIVARLTSIERTDENAKAGVMVRESIAANSRNAFMMAFPTTAPSAPGAYPMGKGSRLQFRARVSDELTGFYDLVSLSSMTPDAAPIWLRLTRRGAVLTGFVSADGATWLRDGETTLNMPDPVLAGLAVTSHSNNNGNVASFQGLRITALTDPAFAHAEVGTLGGYAAGAPARLNLSNAGRGLANTEDGLTFVYRTEQQLGDVEVTARVAALRRGGNAAARIGLALRGNLEGGARMAAFVLELSNTRQRYRLQRRAQDDGNLTNTEDMRAMAVPDGGALADAAPVATDAAASDGGGVDAAPPPIELQPVWLKLVRVGQRFVGFISEDGNTWLAVVDVPSFVIASNALAGVILTSGSEGETSSGTVESLTIGAPVTPLPVRPDAGMPDAPAADAPAGG